MQFLSQYSSVALQLFDGHPLGKDSRWIVIQPTGTTRGTTFDPQSRGFLVDVLYFIDRPADMCDLFPGTSWFCDCRTSFVAYSLFAMTCKLQNPLRPSSLNSMPIPEFL
jgi:hypothetical protein